MAVIKRKLRSDPLSPWEVEIPDTTLGVWFLNFGERGCWFGLLSRRAEDDRLLLENHWCFPNESEGVGHNAQLAPEGVTETCGIERARGMFEELHKKVRKAKGFEVLRGGRTREEFMHLLSSMPFLEDEEEPTPPPALLTIGAVLAHKHNMAPPANGESAKPVRGLETGPGASSKPNKRGGVLVIIKPDGTREEKRWEGKCQLEMLQQGVGGHIERVKVRYNGRVRDGWVNENGIAENLTPNIWAGEFVRKDYLTLGPIFGNLVIQIPDPAPKSKKEVL